MVQAKVVSEHIQVKLVQDHTTKFCRQSFSVWRKATKSFWEHDYSARQLQLILVVLTGIWELVLQVMVTNTNNVEKSTVKVSPFSFICSKSIKEGVSFAKKQQCAPCHASSSLKCKSTCQDLWFSRNGWLSIWQFPTSRCISGSRIFSTSPDVHWRDMDSCKVKSGTAPVPQILA